MFGQYHSESSMYHLHYFNSAVHEFLIILIYSSGKHYV